MYADDYYYYNYEMNEEVMDVAFAVAGFLLVFALIVLVVGLIMYVFQSVGLYTIAKRRGIRHAWLAWIPVACYWVVGCIADQYRYVAKGQVKNRRTVMLVLALVSMVMGGVSSAVSGTGFTAILEQLASSGTQAAQGLVAGSSIGISLLVALVSSVVSLVLVVFWFISLYDLYTSCNPGSSVVFLVLGIIFSFLNAIFIFADRNRDDGMPPRRQPVQEPQWQPSEPPKEPWEENL